MTSLIDRLLWLWAEPLPDGSAAESAFRELYTDPVIVNVVGGVLPGRRPDRQRG